jgi:hypothetical protein
MWRSRDGNNTLQKNNSIEDLVGNEENGYPVPDLKKITINMTKELSNTFKEKTWKEISEKFMEKILDIVN